MEPTQTEIVEVRVSNKSESSKVAGAIAYICRQHKTVVVRSLGTYSTIKALSAISTASSFLLGDGIKLMTEVEFVQATVEKGMRIPGYAFKLYLLKE